jgi:hypothetical protein
MLSEEIKFIAIMLIVIVGGTFLQRYLNIMNEKKPEVLLQRKMVFVAFAQFILHYLGIISIILGIIAMLFANTSRGLELVISGIGFLFFKTILRFWVIYSIPNDNSKNK